MYNLTSWWRQQTEKAKAYKAPEKCTFCLDPIKDGDFFHAGYDANRIYAETCDNLKCYTWLVKKVRIKKLAGKDYLKELERRAKEQE